MSKFLTPPVWYDKNGNLVEILTGSSTEPGNIAIGTGSNANGGENVVIGSNAIATWTGQESGGNNNIAIGTGSNANDIGGIAIGSNATAAAELSGTNNIAIGMGSNAHGGENIVIGHNAIAEGEGEYGGTQNIVIGTANEVYGTENIVIGTGIELGTNIKGSNYAIQIGKSNSIYTFKVGSIDVFGTMHASDSGTFTGSGGGSGNYTADFYRLGGLATLAAQVTFNPANDQDSFSLTINIPQEYKPSKNIRINSVVTEPTATQIWNLLSNVSDNLAVGTTPAEGWIVQDSEIGYKIISSNGQWRVGGSARRTPSLATLTMRCVYII